MTSAKKRPSPTKRYAIDKVKMSGLDLVQARKARGPLASVRDIAKLDWEPWEHSPTPGPNADTMNYLGFYSRVASGIMARTKTQLVDSQDKLKEKGIDKLVAGLMDTA